MSLRDFFFLILVCFLFGMNFVIAAWSVGEHGVPPFMLAACRAICVILIMHRYLLAPRPAHFWRLILVCICVGPFHLGFLYTGLASAPASASSIVSQILIPFATILSVIFLKERIGPIRLLGITGAFIGTIVMIYDPNSFGLDIGLIYVVLAYLFMAIGSIIMKTVGDIDWRVYVAWMAVCVLGACAPLSWLTEIPIAQVWTQAAFPLVATALYGAIGVTIIAHGQYYRLIKTYDVSQIVPLTLMVPLFSTILGIWLLGEELTLMMIVGAGLILPCVYVIAVRDGKAAGVKRDSVDNS